MDPRAYTVFDQEEEWDWVTSEAGQNASERATPILGVRSAYDPEWYTDLPMTPSTLRTETPPTLRVVAPAWPIPQGNPARTPPNRGRPGGRRARSPYLGSGLPTIPNGIHSTYIPDSPDRGSRVPADPSVAGRFVLGFEGDDPNLIDDPFWPLYSGEDFAVQDHGYRGDNHTFTLPVNFEGRPTWPLGVVPQYFRQHFNPRTPHIITFSSAPSRYRRHITPTHTPRPTRRSMNHNGQYNMPSGNSAFAYVPPPASIQLPQYMNPEQQHFATSSTGSEGSIMSQIPPLPYHGTGNAYNAPQGYGNNAYQPPHGDFALPAAPFAPSPFVLSPFATPNIGSNGFEPQNHQSSRPLNPHSPSFIPGGFENNPQYPTANANSFNTSFESNNSASTFGSNMTSSTQFMTQVGGPTAYSAPNAYGNMPSANNPQFGGNFGMAAAAPPMIPPPMAAPYGSYSTYSNFGPSNSHFHGYVNSGAMIPPPPPLHAAGYAGAAAPYSNIGRGGHSAGDTHNMNSFPNPQLRHNGGRNQQYPVQPQQIVKPSNANRGKPVVYNSFQNRSQRPSNLATAPVMRNSPFQQYNRPQAEGGPVRAPSTKLPPSPSQSRFSQVSEVTTATTSAAESHVQTPAQQPVVPEQKSEARSVHTPTPLLRSLRGQTVSVHGSHHTELAMWAADVAKSRNRSGSGNTSVVLSSAQRLPPPKMTGLGVNMGAASHEANTNDPFVAKAPTAKLPHTDPVQPVSYAGPLVPAGGDAKMGPSPVTALRYTNPFEPVDLFNLVGPTDPTTNRTVGGIVNGIPMGPNPEVWALTGYGAGRKPKISDALDPKYLPFAEHARTNQEQKWGVIKISNIPYSVTRPEILAFLGRNARIVPENCHEPIHIVMERVTSKTLDCYVEFINLNEAVNAVKRFENNRSGGRGGRLGQRHVDVEMSSQDALMKDLFPKAKNVKWQGHRPVIIPRDPNDIYNSGFQGFISKEELIMLVKHVETPQRSPFSKDCPQRPFECLISTLIKYPWYMVDHITIEDRDLLHKTTVDLIRLLREKLEDKDANMNLNQMLFKRVWRAALWCDGFSECQRDDIFFHAGLDPALAIPMSIPPFATGWKYLHTIGPKRALPWDICYYYAWMIRDATETKQNELSLAEKAAQGIVNEEPKLFGYLHKYFGNHKREDFIHLTLAQVAAEEWAGIEKCLRMACRADDED